jgi:hypothetical protein
VIAPPLADSGQTTGPAEGRRTTQRQNRRQRVALAAGLAKVRNFGSSMEQGVTGNGAHTHLHVVLRQGEFTPVLHLMVRSIGQ